MSDVNENTLNNDIAIGLDNINKMLDGILLSNKEKIGELYPIINPMLVNETEYIKMLYYRVLSVVLLSISIPTKAQIQFMKRLLTGSKCEKSIEEYEKMAITIDEDDLNEFVAQFSIVNVRYIFIIDALIIISLGDVNEKQYDFVANVAEILKININEITYLSAISKAIILQNIKKVDEAKKIMPESLVHLDLSEYLKQFYVGPITDTSSKVHFYASEKTNFNLYDEDTAKMLNRQNIIFENLILKIDSPLCFQNIESVEFINCTFLGGENRIEFKNIEKVSICDCNISNFCNRFAVLLDVHYLNVEKNFISDCACSVFDGAVFYSEYVICNIRDNTVKNCYNSMTSYQTTGYAFYYGRGEVCADNNIFIGCHVDGVCNYKYLLYANSITATNNTIKGDNIKNLYEE